MIAGGETTVTVDDDHGMGGRCHELCLAAGIQLGQSYKTLKDRKPKSAAFLLCAGK